MEQNQKQKRSSWILPRHRWIQWLAKGPVGTFCRWKTGVKVEPFKAQGDRNYLVLMNHQTVYDQFFVGMAFRGPVYYLATEDIFSMGWVLVMPRSIWLNVIKKTTGSNMLVVSFHLIANILASVWIWV